MACVVCKAEYITYRTLPLLGRVCRTCRDRLSKPTLQCGAVMNTSIADLCQLYSDEIDGRRAILLSQAKDVCGVETKGE